MQQIIPTSEWLSKGHDLKRFYVKLSDGRKMPRARLVMMNLLHTDHLPRKFHVHHDNEDSLDDLPINLLLRKGSHHISQHGNPLGIDPKILRKNNLKKYNNSDKAKERVKKWKEDNKDHLNAWYRNYYKEHKFL
jgi:hypothetical protein